MKKTVWTAVSSTFLLAGVWFGATLVRPQVSKAITAVEMPAFVFPLVSLQGSQTPMLCMNNMGDGSVRTLIGLLEVADSGRAVSPLLPVTLAAHQGTCVNLATGRGPTSAGSTVTLLPAVFVAAGNDNAAGGGGGTGKGLVSSLQGRDDAGTRFVVTPTLMNQVTVPTASLVP